MSFNQGCVLLLHTFTWWLIVITPSCPYLYPRQKSRVALQSQRRNTFKRIEDSQTSIRQQSRRVYPKIRVAANGNRVLRPNEILHSNTYRRIGYLDRSNTKAPGLPLQTAIDQLTRSVTLIADTLTKGMHASSKYDSTIDQSILREIDALLSGNNPHTISSLWADDASNSLETTYFTIRIEQPLSHPVDPLCWIHQNIPPITDHSTPIFYLANAEGTFEVSAYGSSLTLHSLTTNHQFNNATWDIIQNLPWGSKVYGGSRFDNTINTTIADEWQDFGSAFWFLPAVELKREASTAAMSGREPKNPFKETTFSVHLHFSCPWTLLQSAQHVLQQLQRVTHYSSPPIPCTTLPPIIARGANDLIQECFEHGVKAALDSIDQSEDRTNKLEKVVLARKAELYLGAGVSGLDIMMKLRFGCHVGHLFFLYPGSTDRDMRREFLGCTPERLFQVNSITGKVSSEALAGTRPRGSTTESDALLLNDLMNSEKDLNENMITGTFVKRVFSQLDQLGLIGFQQSTHGESGGEGNSYFVRRLRHLQHICQLVEGKIKDSSKIVEISKYLLDNLHPTPAICGFPAESALQFIQSYESINFDRGFYSGPIGYFGRDSADILVGIRSSLLSREQNIISSSEADVGMIMSVYAGAGIVSGSTPQAEWSETSYKLEVLSSLFSQSPFSLQSAVNVNVAWASSFVEELIRCGVTQWYICPGSRSTPLTAAVAKALRLHVGSISAISVHDERAAGFRALGYGRATNRPAAVITSSGTAVANLYPAVMEAGIDGIPLLLLTADRPYENRDNGSNQSVDQVKVFSSTYVRWFRDIASPTDEISISLALSDANHAVSMSSQLRGPVHLNIQFQENLAPESGKIRGDNRLGSNTRFSHARFTDVPGFLRWSTSGGKFLYSASERRFNNPGVISHGSTAYDIAMMIIQSQRGLIVIGNARSVAAKDVAVDSSAFAASIADFADFVGIPIFCGAQSAQLRFQSAMVVPFGEHVLRHPDVKSNMNPDLIIQIGATLVSTEVQDLIALSSRNNKKTSHVLIHPHHPAERNDPSFTVTHKISADPIDFLQSVRYHLTMIGADYKSLGSALLPVISLGRALAREMPSIIHRSSSLDERIVDAMIPGNIPDLTEPQIILAMAEVLAMKRMNEHKLALFLSNSMPVRDAEFFLYPTEYKVGTISDLVAVAVNRGASGIDGIISTATGFGEGADIPTTLLIGDLATIHDLNSFHNLVRNKPTSSSPRQAFQLTTIIVNNDGGAIFSFLPIANHGTDVGFEDFFGTPTNAFSYVKGIEAFGLPVSCVSSYEGFKSTYSDTLNDHSHRVIEARVVARDQNVKVHSSISKQSITFLESYLSGASNYTVSGALMHSKLYIKTYGKVEINQSFELSSSLPPRSDEKIIVLLHGWMGDKDDWDEIGTFLTNKLPEWRVLSIDLPGHGDSTHISDTTGKSLFSSDSEASITDVAKTVLRSLTVDHGIQKLDAICGYSLGGRILMEMKRLCLLEGLPTISHEYSLITPDTKVILLSADPGMPLIRSEFERRRHKDYQLASRIHRLNHKTKLSLMHADDSIRTWIDFVDSWYQADIWGDMKNRRPDRYFKMAQKRALALSLRGSDFAQILRICSPIETVTSLSDDFASQFYFVSGNLDQKYGNIGRRLEAQYINVQHIEIEDAGHGLLVDAPKEVSEIIRSILNIATSETLSKAENLVLIETDGGELNTSYSQVNELPQTTVLNSKSVQVLRPCNLEFDYFSVELGVSSGKRNGVTGIGWGEKSKGSLMKERQGYIISLSTVDSNLIGIGEISPLDGVHQESVDEAGAQLAMLRESLGRNIHTIPPLPAERILALDGSLDLYIQILCDHLFTSVDGRDTRLLPSVRAGLEMALLSIASQALQISLVDVLTKTSSVPIRNERTDFPMLLPLNGLVTKDDAFAENSINKADAVLYQSTKVKVGESTPFEDAQRILRALPEQSISINGQSKPAKRYLRADANRSWDEYQASDFVMFLKALDPDSIDYFEFVEEPLVRFSAGLNEWSLGDQLEALERFYAETGIKYALDESLADTVAFLDFQFEKISETLINLFQSRKPSGCAALILKPSLLGLELSTRLASLAYESLQVGAVFSSTLESGVGLGYIAILAASADCRHCRSGEKRYSHGLSTFNLFAADTLSPPFATFVTSDGAVDTVPLSKALLSLSLDEMRQSFSIEEPIENNSIKDSDEDFQVTSLSSGSGREISVQVSLLLPFSEDIAYDRFTDLPQQPRWSPWLKSVSYLNGGDETEWTLNIRGVEFRWRATRKLLSKPKGVMWESTSGLKNKGLVEFHKSSESSCLMKLKMRIITPRIVSTIFRSTGEFVKDFVENKLLKWSLESFRDVVKADLALQRGDAELGDALYGAVEGRSNAIEATLSP